MIGMKHELQEQLQYKNVFGMLKLIVTLYCKFNTV